MSITPAHADHFYSEVIRHRMVWTIRDRQGFPTSTNSLGETAMPFWSAESRARKILANAEAYAGFETHRINLSEFIERWLPGLSRDGVLAGLNWSGGRATGFDVPASVVLRRLELAMSSSRAAPTQDF